MKVLYVRNTKVRTGVSFSGKANENALSKLPNFSITHEVTPGINVVIKHDVGMSLFNDDRCPIFRLVETGIPAVAYWVIEGDKANYFDKYSKGFNQVWTPSIASRDALIAAGLELPIKVIPHIVNPAPAVENNNNNFTILTCAHTPLPRKGHKYSLEIFKKAFPLKKYPDIRWIIKFQEKETNRVVRRFISRTKVLNDPRIKFICDDIQNMDVIYNQSHVLLHTHMAGAFEINCAEAAIRGIPVIATDTGGPRDFLLSDYLIPVLGKIECSEISRELIGLINHSSHWAIPDVEKGAVLLRDCYENYQQWKDNAVKHRDYVKTYCDEKRIGKLMSDALRELPRVSWPKSFKNKGNSLEIIWNDSKLPTIGVISHRRSGTHYTGELISKAWNTSWFKSHSPNKQISDSIPWVYVIRNPIDCIYKTFKWFSPGGGAGNTQIAKILSPFTFEQYLDGCAGEQAGYNIYPEINGLPKDNLKSFAGGFYDPISFWENHVIYYLSANISFVIYENLLKNPLSLDNIITPILGEKQFPINHQLHPVGHKPSMDTVGSSIDFWSDKHLELINIILHSRREELNGNSILEKMGFNSLKEWITTVI